MEYFPFISVMIIQKFCSGVFLRAFIFLIIMVGGYGCSPRPSTSLKIATAANMEYAMKEIIAEFENNTTIDCDLILGSSGKLTAQIREGAPFDVFVSADMKYPETLFLGNLTTTHPRIYASGQLIWWSMTGVELDSINKNSLKQVKNIAIANPKTAPYGQAAKEMLTNTQLWDSIQAKLVFAESIGQTNQYIESAVVDLGITSLSVVKAPKMEGKGNWKIIDSTSYSPIHQGAVLIRSDKKTPSKEAKIFYDFLFSETVKAILEKNGYQVPQ
ncbi:molybdate ABC transporter substrate-binding protein [Echinicola pacifica]|nr:molybdate ABC transporter substrate-binding protein [Echinicola pacifica]